MIPPIYSIYNPLALSPEPDSNKRSFDEMSDKDSADDSTPNKRQKTVTPSPPTLALPSPLLPPSTQLPPSVKKSPFIIPQSKTINYSTATTATNEHYDPKFMEQLSVILAAQLSADFTGESRISFEENEEAGSISLPDIIFPLDNPFQNATTSTTNTAALSVLIPSTESTDLLFSTIPPNIKTPTLTPLAVIDPSHQNLQKYDSPESFAKRLKEISSLYSFEERISAFKKLMTPIYLPVEPKIEPKTKKKGSFAPVEPQLKIAHSCLIKLHEDKQNPDKSVSVVVLIDKGPYFSNAFAERCFLNSFEQPGEKEYYRIQVFEQRGTEKLFSGDPLMKLRACEQNGELVWIGNGKQIRSLDQLSRYYLPIEEMLGIDMWLYDDASIALSHVKLRKNGRNVKNDKRVNAELNLKALQVIGHRNGTTSYQRKFGYDVANCTDWIRDATDDPNCPFIGHTFTQKKAAYLLAVRNVRAMTVKQFYEFYQSRGKDAAKFVAIVARAFGQNAKEQFEIKNCTRTLRELEATVAENVKSAKGDIAKTLTQHDQYDLQHTAFWSHKVSKTASETEKQYWKDIQTIANAAVFVKYKK